MSVRLRLGARFSAALVVVAVPVSMTGLSPAIVPTSQPVAPRAVASAHVSTAPIAPSVTTLQRHYVRTLPVSQRPQVVAEQTTITGGLALRTKAERNRKIAVSSVKGSHVWTASSLAEHDLPSAAMRAYKHAAASIDTHRPRLPPPVDAAGRHRPGRVRPRPVRRLGARQRRRPASRDRRRRR